MIARAIVENKVLVFIAYRVYMCVHWLPYSTLRIGLVSLSTQRLG